MSTQARLLSRALLPCALACMGRLPDLLLTLCCRSCADGYNVCLLAYGQTGSG